MAYRRLAEAGAADFAGNLALLDPLSRRVVMLSLREGARGFGRRSRLARALGALFGLSRPVPLADPGLETLRRYCILYRLGDHVEAAALEQQLRGLGRSAAELQEIRAWIGKAGR